MIAAVKEVTVDGGNDEATETSHLGHFLLTHLLLDRIIESGPSRIINVSSDGRESAHGFDPYDISFNRRPSSFDHLQAYFGSKLMNLLFTRELARRLYGKGVTVNALHPGLVQTDILRPRISLFPYTVISLLWGWLFFKDEVDGSQTTLYLATSDEVQHVSGQYFADCKLAVLSLLAADEQLAVSLWTESERATGLGS